MKIYIPRDNQKLELRSAVSPETAKKLLELGFAVDVQAGAGKGSGWSDEDFGEAGASMVAESHDADIVLRVNPPDEAEIGQLKKGALHVSFLDPFNRPDLLKAFAEAGVSAVSLEMLPRTTLAQKMDALSSQANLAGYSSVMLAGDRMNKIIPMMMTPAGTISPARFLIIGVGVAGLQAIATARRLGGRVEAFDTRPEVEEQVKSLGAKFVKLKIGETEGTAQGYAKELSAEQLALQQKGMEAICARADVVITTAKLFGRKAPIIVTSECIAAMRSGSIVVDLAAETGGNVAGTVLGEEVISENGVRIVGLGCLEGQVAQHASQVYAANLANFIEHFRDKESPTLVLNREDEILAGCLLTHEGAIVHERFKSETPS